MTKKQGVLIVDREPIVRCGLSHLLTETGDYTIIGEADDALTAIEIVVKNRPELVIADIDLKDGRGIDLVRDLVAANQDLVILVFSRQDECIFADHALRAGAHGYVMKDEQSSKILEAIKLVLAGEVYVSGPLRIKLLRRLIGNRDAVLTSPLELLSSRELEVFRLIGTGFSTRKIADSLHLGIKTVETYRFNIKKKLGIKDNTELIHSAAKWFINPGVQS